MGDISREPLSTGPSPRGKRRKGPAEVIRLEEISIQESSIDEAPASRGPSEADDAGGRDGRGRGVGEARGVREARSAEDRPVTEECVVEQGGSDERGSGLGDASDASRQPEAGAGPESSTGSEADAEPSTDAAADALESEIVVRPRPELVAALERDAVDAEAADEAELTTEGRAVPEVEQLVADDPDEQIAEPMLAELRFADGEGDGLEQSELDLQSAEALEFDELGLADLETDAFETDTAEFDTAEFDTAEFDAATHPAAGHGAKSGSLRVPGELPLDSAASVPAVEDDAEVPELTEPGTLSRVLVAVLLTAREPMKAVRLAEICNSSQKAVEAALERLDADLRAMGMPLEVVHAGETIRLGTSPEVFPYLVRLRKARKAERLSPAALETLAVIAYQQPVIRLEIEAIRGVKVGPMLKSLLDHKLVKVVGRADVPGRPLQYGTTQVFLERFGLRSLKDLPSVQEFRSLG